MPDKAKTSEDLVKLLCEDWFLSLRLAANFLLLSAELAFSLSLFLRAEVCPMKTPSGPKYLAVIT